MLARRAPARRPFACRAAAYAALAAVVIAQSAGAQAGAPRLSRDFAVGQQDIWTITDLDVQPGERVVFTAAGSARCPGAANSFGPEGIPRGFRDLLRILPIAQAGRIGRVIVVYGHRTVN